MGGLIIYIYIFGDVVLSVIGLGGAKNGSKRGRGIVTIARIPFKTFSLESSIPLLQDALVWS